MKVFCALMTMIGRSGRMLLDARQQIEGVVVGHDDVGDDEIALALATQRHSAAPLPVARTS